MFNLFKKYKSDLFVSEGTKKVKPYVAERKIQRGVFLVGNEIIEGAYFNDKLRTFVTDCGVANISKGVKVKFIVEKEVDPMVEWQIDYVQKGYEPRNITIC